MTRRTKIFYNKSLATLGIVVILVLAGPSPVQAGWSEEFDSDLSDWQLGATDWSTTGVATAIDHTWILEDGQLISRTEKFQNAHNQACRNFDHQLRKTKLDVFTTSGLWGVYVGKNFNLFETLPTGEIRFEGVMIKLSLGLVQTDGDNTGTGTLDIIDYSSSDFSKTPIQYSGIDAQGRSLPRILNNWVSLVLKFNDDKLQLSLSYAAGDVSYAVTNPISSVDDSNTLCLAGFHGGDIAWDNVVVSTLPNYLNSPPFIAAVIGTMVSLGYGGVYYRNSMVRRRYITKLGERHVPQKVMSQLKAEGELTDTLLMTLLNQKDDNNPNYINEIKNNTPVDLLSFKYLLHPTRLLIVKILYAEYKLTSYAMRQILDISSGEFSTHKKSLEDNGYIESKNSFSLTKGKEQVLYLTKKGTSEFKQVYELLSDFMDERTPYYYLLRVKDHVERENVLYPNK